jgi:hypothetical protein
MLDILTLLKKEYDVTEAILRVRLSRSFVLRISISILHPLVAISYIHVFPSPPSSTGYHLSLSLILHVGLQSRSSGRQTSLPRQQAGLRARQGARQEMEDAGRCCEGEEWEYSFERQEFSCTK